MKSYLLLIILSFSYLSIIAQSEWHWQNPLPQGNYLNSTCFTDSANGCVIGDNGTILKTKDGGKSWVIIPTITNYQLFKIAFPSQQIGYISGSVGTILKTTNGGDNWVIQNSKTKQGILSISFPTVDVGYLLTDLNELIKTTDGGLNWNLISKGTSNLPLDHYAVHFTGQDIGYIGGSDGNIYKTIDGGNTWNPTPLISNPTTQIVIKLIYFPDPFNGYAVVDDNNSFTFTTLHRLFKTTNSGRNWIEITNSVPNFDFSPRAISFYDKNNGSVLGMSSIITTHDGGNTWKSRQSDDLADVAMINPNLIYAIGYTDSTMLTTNNGGMSWTRSTSGFGEDLTSTYFTQPNIGYAVGNKGTILKTLDGGQSWIKQESGVIGINFTQFESISFCDPLIGCVVGEDGRILRTEDGGVNWKVISQIGGTLKKIIFINPTTGYIVGTEGRIFKTVDSGITWIPQTSGTLSYLFDISFPDSNTGYIVGDLGLVLKTTNGGKSWSNIQLPTSSSTANAVFFTDANTGCVVQSNCIYRTIDGGANWTLQYTLPGMSLQGGIPEFFISSIVFENSQVGWCVGWNGGILKTIDGGINWISQPSCTNIFLKSVFFTQNNVGHAVGERGVILAKETSTVSKKEEINLSKLKLYPNPSNDYFSIEIDNSNLDRIRVLIVDLNGNVLEEKYSYKSKIEFCTKNIKSGIYFVKLQKGNKIYREKLVII